MKTKTIEEQAELVLNTLGLRSTPVDPFAIVREEGIEPAPGTYGPRFDARLEYVRSADAFILYYREPGPGRTEGRVRFSIGHELGHYYLHADYLLSGKAHDSRTDFASRKPMEREADEFAAALLMPADLFVRKVRTFQQRVCTLSELCHLADCVFCTSLTSTALRYCECNLEPCSVVLSEGGRILWTQHSEDMKRFGLSFIPAGPVPAPSRSAQVWDQVRRGRSPDREGMSIEADVWFERGFRGRLWEEAIALGNSGLVLTYLTLEDPPDGDD